MTEDNRGGGRAIADLGQLLGQLDSNAETESHRAVISDLISRLNGTDGWAELDLVATLGGERGHARQARWRTVIDALPPLLVFLPILLTWLSLWAATSAYRSLEASTQLRAANAGKSFLELWQEGFAGRLPGWLSFGNVAVYTVATISLLIILTAASIQLRRRDEARAGDAQARLLPTLVRAQAELNRQRLGSPARFAAELSHAAAGLRQLLEDTARTQNSATTLARQNQILSEQLGEDATAMMHSTSELHSAAELMRTAADALAKANTVLATEVTGQVEVSARRLDQAASQAAAQVGGLVQTGQSALDGITERFDDTMAAVKEQMTSAASAMVDAGKRHADAVGASSDRAADDIVHAYQEAVRAVTVTLAGDLARTTSTLQSIMSGLRASADDQLAAARLTEQAAQRTEQAVAAHTTAVASTSQTMAGTVDALRHTMTAYASVQEELTGSLRGIADGLAAQAAAQPGRAAADADAADWVLTDASPPPAGPAESGAPLFRVLDRHNDEGFS